jgi:hypothetical protein
MIGSPGGKAVKEKVEDLSEPPPTSAMVMASGTLFSITVGYAAMRTSRSKRAGEDATIRETDTPTPLTFELSCSWVLGSVTSIPIFETPTRTIVLCELSPLLGLA